MHSKPYKPPAPSAFNEATVRLLCACCRAVYAAADARVPFEALYIKHGEEGQRAGGENHSF
jgi:hypothetical protein